MLCMMFARFSNFAKGSYNASRMAPLTSLRVIISGACISDAETVMGAFIIKAVMLSKSWWMCFGQWLEHRAQHLGPAS